MEGVLKKGRGGEKGEVWGKRRGERGWERVKRWEKGGKKVENEE